MEFDVALVISVVGGVLAIIISVRQLLNGFKNDIKSGMDVQFQAFKESVTKSLDQVCSDVAAVKKDVNLLENRVIVIDSTVNNLAKANDRHEERINIIDAKASKVTMCK